MTPLEAEALTLAKQLRNAVMSAPVDIDAAEAMQIPLIKALQARERAVWEAAAKHIVDEEDDFTTFVDSGGPIPDAEFDVKKFADWCRAQAAKEQP